MNMNNIKSQPRELSLDEIEHVSGGSRLRRDTYTCITTPDPNQPGGATTCYKNPKSTTTKGFGYIGGIGGAVGGAIAGAGSPITEVIFVAGGGLVGQDVGEEVGEKVQDLVNAIKNLPEILEAYNGGFGTMLDFWYRDTFNLL